MTPEDLAALFAHLKGRPVTEEDIAEFRRLWPRIEAKRQALLEQGGQPDGPSPAPAPEIVQDSA